MDPDPAPAAPQRSGEAMRKLRKAAVVAAMTASMGMFGAGVAAAGGYGGGGYGGGGDVRISNPQFLNCAYINNTNTALTQTGTPAAGGDVFNFAHLGNFCPQVGPSFLL